MITVILQTMPDGRLIFAPKGDPSHTFDDQTAAKYFALGYTQAKLMAVNADKVEALTGVRVKVIPFSPEVWAAFIAL